jgi:GDP-L-fucose synthase
VKDGKIYVAGHRGMVGSALVRRLEARGCRNLVTRPRDRLDLTDPAAVREFFEQERPEYVFLAAARVGGIMANVRRGGEFIHQNLMIQANVLEQSRLCGVKRLVFLGSSCIYPRLAPQPIREEYLMTGPLESTNSPYAVAKIAGVEMCAAYNAQYGTSFVPVMPTNLYGPGDNFDLMDAHVIPAVMRKLHLGRLAMQGDRRAIGADEERWGPIPAGLRRELDAGGAVVSLWGTGTPSREFMHVDDLADACILVMFGTDSTELINIGVGTDSAIRDVAQLVAEVVGYGGRLGWDTSRPDGTPRKLLDVTRLSALGFVPGVPLRRGVESLYQWYLAQ